MCVVISLLTDEQVEVRYLSGEQDLSNYTVPNVKLGRGEVVV